MRTLKDRPAGTSRPGRKNLERLKHAPDEELWAELCRNMYTILTMSREQSVSVVSDIFSKFGPVCPGAVSALSARLDNECPQLSCDEIVKIREVLGDAAARPVKQGLAADEDEMKAALSRRITGAAHYVLNVACDDESLVQAMKSAVRHMGRKDLPLLREAFEEVAFQSGLDNRESNRLRNVLYEAALGKREGSAMARLHRVLAELDVVPDKKFYQLLSDWVKPSRALQNISAVVDFYGPETASDLLRASIDVIGLSVKEIEKAGRIF
ncbi:hypothetical protein GF318_04760 [Candidatus Micrarchaeota archaeon]|nr:hypothetical protein [Candidatus Micrarchaeota archaeon]